MAVSSRQLTSDIIITEAPITGLTGNVTAGNPVILAMSSTVGLAPGQLLGVTANFAANTRIKSVDSAAQITLESGTSVLAPGAAVAISVTNGAAVGMAFYEIVGGNGWDPALSVDGTQSNAAAMRVCTAVAGNTYTLSQNNKVFNLAGTEGDDHFLQNTYGVPTTVRPTPGSGEYELSVTRQISATQRIVAIQGPAQQV